MEIIKGQKWIKTLKEAKNIVWSYFKNTLIYIFRYDFYKILGQ